MISFPIYGIAAVAVWRLILWIYEEWAAEQALKEIRKFEAVQRRQKLQSPAPPVDHRPLEVQEQERLEQRMKWAASVLSRSDDGSERVSWPRRSPASCRPDSA